MVENNRVNSS